MGKHASTDRPTDRLTDRPTEHVHPSHVIQICCTHTCPHHCNLCVVVNNAVCSSDDSYKTENADDGKAKSRHLRNKLWGWNERETSKDKVEHGRLDSSMPGSKCRHYTTVTMFSLHYTMTTMSRIAHRHLRHIHLFMLVLPCRYIKHCLDPTFSRSHAAPPPHHAMPCHTMPQYSSARPQQWWSSVQLYFYL